MTYRSLILCLILLPLVVVGTSTRSQQDEADTCPSLVQVALTAVDGNCSDLSRNNGCYGYDRVDATFSQEVPEDFFTDPGDRTELTFLDQLRTSPMDLETGQWGVSALKLQANIPNTLPGQAVTVLVMGDTEVENAVNPDEALTPRDPITVTTRREVVIILDPELYREPIGTLPPGTELLADAVNPDGTRVRILYDDFAAWTSRADVEESSEIDDLSVVDDQTQTPMQAFYFETGIGTTGCREAPSSVLVQGPEEYTVDITANGVDIRVGSTVWLRTLPHSGPGGSEDPSTSGLDMEIVTLSGIVIIEPGTEQEIIIPAGFSIRGTLRPRQDTTPGAEETPEPGLEFLGGNGFVFVIDEIVPQPLSETLLEELGLIIEYAPFNFLNYRFELPGEQTSDTEATPTPTLVPVRQDVSTATPTLTPTATPVSPTPVGNAPPVPSFTVSCTALTCNFDGSGSTDSDGTIVRYTWWFGDGNTPHHVGPTVSHTYSAAGNYTVTLEVGDEDAAAAIARQTITANTPPTASFTVSCTGLSCSFDGSGSTDPDGSLASFAWNFGDGATGSGAQTSHTYSTSGTYTVSLTVTDNLGKTAVTTQGVTANTPPTASFTFSCARLSCSFDGSGSTDPDGSLASFAWNFGDGATGSGAQTSHTYSTSGTFTVNLTVTDNLGANGSTNQNVSLNLPPTASFTFSCNGVDCSFDGSGSTDPDGSITSYAWSFGDGINSTGATVSHRYEVSGVYTVTLTVTDNVGATGSTSQTVDAVVNQPPSASFRVVGCTAVTSMEWDCVFDGSGSSDPDGTIVSYAWDFGDGAPATAAGVNPTHRYVGEGCRDVSLTVTDNDGATDTITQAQAVCLIA